MLHSVRESHSPKHRAPSGVCTVDLIGTAGGRLRLNPQEDIISEDGSYLAGRRVTEGSTFCSLHMRTRSYVVASDDAYRKSDAPLIHLPLRCSTVLTLEASHTTRTGRYQNNDALSWLKEYCPYINRRHGKQKLFSSEQIALILRVTVWRLLGLYNACFF